MGESVNGLWQSMIYGTIVCFCAIIFSHIISVLNSSGELTYLCDYSGVDSIAWLSDTKQYFITIGNYYWMIDENQLSSQTIGKALPQYFEPSASAYINALKNCAQQSGASNKIHQQVIVIEKKLTNTYMQFDARTKNFTNLPKSYYGYRVINQISVDWTNKLDAMFDYQTYEIFAIQGDSYAGHNWSNLCDNPSKPTEIYETHSITADFNITANITAAMYKEDRGLYLFATDVYYILRFDKNFRENGRFRVLSKSAAKSVKYDFFRCTYK